MYNISKVADEQANVGEGPLWDDESQLLYWADTVSYTHLTLPTSG